MKKILCILLPLMLFLCSCFASPDVSALTGDELVVALAFPTEDAATLSPEARNAYTAACLELEIMNGGLCQFFANCPDCAAFVPEALELLGADEHRALYDRFLSDTGIDPLDPMFQTEDLEEFSRLYDLYPWDDFDDAYCALTPMPQILEDYIQSNPDAF